MRISELLQQKTFKVTKGGSWWTDIVGRFHSHLVENYKAYTGRDLKIARVAQKLAPFKYSKELLEDFFRDCEKSKDFNKTFFGRLKV